MITAEKIAAAKRAGQMIYEDYHCSEAFVIAVGAALSGKVEDCLVKASTPFAGGVGKGYCELCGALSGGVLLIGYLYGRTNAKVDDKKCLQLAKTYRERFNKAFGTTICCELRKDLDRAEAKKRCQMLIETGAMLFFDLLEE